MTQLDHVLIQSDDLKAIGEWAGNNLELTWKITSGWLGHHRGP
jgi:hypothetical protein